MHLCSSCLGVLAIPEMPEQPSRGDEGYGDFHMQRIAEATGGGAMPTSMPMPRSSPNWLLWGGLAVGAWFLLKRK